MKVFEYEGIDENKNRYRGRIKAVSNKEAVAKLCHRGIAPTWLEEMSQTKIQIENRLDAYKKLRKSLTNEPEPTPNLPTSPTRKPNRDWAYLIFVLLVLTVIAGALAVAQ